MRWSSRLVFAAVILVGSHAVADDGKSSPAKQLQFSVRVFEGDPLGSPEAGTLKVLVDTRVTTMENRPFAIQTGGELKVTGPKGDQFIPFGRMIDGMPNVVKDGKIRLDITLTNATVGEKSDARIQMNSESTRTISTVKQGEAVTLRWGKGSADKQVWAVLTVEQVGP